MKRSVGSQRGWLNFSRPRGCPKLLDSAMAFRVFLSLQHTCQALQRVPSQGSVPGAAVSRFFFLFFPMFHPGGIQPIVLNDEYNVESYR